MDNKDISKKFEALYKANIDPLFRFTVFRVSDREEAIDIVEESFVRLWRELSTKTVNKPRALLYKIARNLIIDWYRKEKSIPVQPFRSDEDGEGEIAIDMFQSTVLHPEVLLETRMVIEKISKLSPIYREAVYLRYVEELSPKEISKIIDESANTISVRINRGVTELKKLLDGN